MAIKIVSSDMNGTFTGGSKPVVIGGKEQVLAEHTMSHMILNHAGEQAFLQAKEVFGRQTSGKATMQEAFGNAAPYYAEMPLRKAIEYAIPANAEDVRHVKFIQGFWDFLGSLADKGMQFLVNSTGYDVTAYVVQEQARQLLQDRNPVMPYSIGNHLLFATKEEAAKAQKGLVTLNLEELSLRQNMLRELVGKYFTDVQTAQNDPIFDQWVATGQLHIGLPSEAAKAELLFAYLQTARPDVKPEEVAHIGDTYGDSGGIIGVAKAGGIGIAFNYNDPLKDAIYKEVRADIDSGDTNLADRIFFVDTKGPNSDMRRLNPVLENPYSEASQAYTARTLMQKEGVLSAAAAKE